MGKLWGVIALVLINTAWAYVPIEEYRGISVKFYDESLRESCINVLKMFPDEKYTGLRMIKFFNFYTSDKVGQYWVYSRVIDTFDGCSYETLGHELAHFCQEKKGDSVREMFEHGGNFQECLKEVYS